MAPRRFTEVQRRNALKYAVEILRRVHFQDVASPLVAGSVARPRIGGRMEYTKFWDAIFISEAIPAASRRIIQLGETHQAVPVRFVNANTIAMADKDSAYRSVITSAGINYPDGLPLAACLSLIARASGGGRRSRVRGPSLFEATLHSSRGSNVTHMFFGGSENTIKDLETMVEAKYPWVNATAYIAPPIAQADELLSLARAAHDLHGGDIVWVGLGGSKQDIVAHNLAQAISRPCIGVGAAFDFTAGRVKAAPRWMQSVGLEWVYRLSQEPRRLWRRYTYGNLRFLKVAIIEIQAQLGSALLRVAAGRTNRHDRNIR